MLAFITTQVRNGDTSGSTVITPAAMIKDALVFVAVTLGRHGLDTKEVGGPPPALEDAGGAISGRTGPDSKPRCLSSWPGDLMPDPRF